jgi:hypothetical protein
MKRFLTTFLLLIILLFSCTTKKEVRDVYRYYWGIKDGYSVWIIDGNKVRKDIYKDSHTVLRMIPQSIRIRSNENRCRSSSENTFQ